MLEEIASYWPFVFNILGVLFGGAVTWTTIRFQLESLVKDSKVQSSRISALEQAKESDRVALADRLARIEVKLDALHIQSEIKR